MGNVPRELRLVPKECSVCGLDMIGVEQRDGTWVLACGPCDFAAALEVEPCPVIGCDRHDHRYA